MDKSILTVTVGLDQRSYDIDIGTGLLQQCGQRIRDRCRVSHAVVITDTNVRDGYGDAVREAVAKQDVAVDMLAVAAGELSKSLSTAETLWDQLLDTGADRRSAVIAVGGGVIGDLAGFIAATFARGLTLVQVPTTLLAQVDSSVGGKVAINLSRAKNMIGAFWQPRYVVIDTDVLKSLPVREYRAGLAEVAKYGVILDSEFFAFLEDNVAAINQRSDDALRHVVARCCQLKANVVEADERDQSGQRAVLNYGHTFAHALESVTGYGHLLHGEAVSIGMICASRLAESLGWIDGSLTQRQYDLLRGFGLPVDVPDVDVDELLRSMQRDKKVEHGRLHFVLPKCLGHVELVGDVSSDVVRDAIQTSTERPRTE